MKQLIEKRVHKLEATVDAYYRAFDFMNKCCNLIDLNLVNKSILLEWKQSVLHNSISPKRRYRAYHEDNHCY